MHEFFLMAKIAPLESLISILEMYIAAYKADKSSVNERRLGFACDMVGIKIGTSDLSLTELNSIVEKHSKIHDAIKAMM